MLLSPLPYALLLLKSHSTQRDEAAGLLVSHCQGAWARWNLVGGMVMLAPVRVTVVTTS